MYEFTEVGSTKCDLSDLCCLSVDVCVRDSSPGAAQLEQVERESTVSSIHENHSKTHSLYLLNKITVLQQPMYALQLLVFLLLNPFMFLRDWNFPPKLTPTHRLITHAQIPNYHPTPGPLSSISVWSSGGWIRHGERPSEGCSHRYGLAVGALSHRGLL